MFMPILLIHLRQKNQIAVFGNVQKLQFAFFLPFYQRLNNALSALRQAQRTMEQFSIIGTEEGHPLFENFGNVQNFKKGMSFLYL